MTAPVDPQRFAAGALCTATTCEGASAELKLTSATNRKIQTPAARIQMIRREAVGVGSDASADFARERAFTAFVVDIARRYRRIRIETSKRPRLKKEVELRNRKQWRIFDVSPRMTLNALVSSLHPETLTWTG